MSYMIIFVYLFMPIFDTFTLLLLYIVIGVMLLLSFLHCITSDAAVIIIFLFACMHIAI